MPLIDTSQLTKLAGDLVRGAAQATAGAEVAVHQSTTDTERDAKTLAPVLTGELRDSIHSRVEGLVGEVIADSDHADYVENGTSKMAAEPYMVPALARNEIGFAHAFERIADTLL